MNQSDNTHHPVDRMFDELIASGAAGNCDRIILKSKCRHGSIEIERHNDRSAHIAQIAVTDGNRRAGCGSKLLKAVIAAADKQGVELELSPICTDPADPSAMTNDLLEKWYVKNGFCPNPQEMSPGRMSRKPIP